MPSPTTNQTRRTYPSIRAYLDDTETTQTEFAKRLGISQSGLNMIVNGKRIPRRKLAIKIAQITGVPLARVLRLDEAR